MRLRLLGPLEVLGEDDRPVALRGNRERVLLAALAVRANETLSSERLIDVLWGEDPPAMAANALQVHFSRLRKKLAEATGEQVLQSGPAGYSLRVKEGELDLKEAERLEQTTGGPGEMSLQLAKALALWRGTALVDVPSDSLEGERARLEELRLSILERRIQADLELGRHLQLVSELEALVHEHSLREGFCRQLMLALYRSSRQADALAAYQSCRKALAEELGIDPSPSLRELEVAIVQQSPELAPSAALPTARDVVGAAETLTFLFTDIEGSTAMLSSQGRVSYARELSAHHEIIRASISAHRGREISTAGDGFFATFPTPSECLLAAAEMQRALSAHEWGGDEIKVRMGVHTGEASSHGEGPVGLDVHKAARIAAVGWGGQVLVSEVTAAIVVDSLPEGLGLRDLGSHRLKDLGRPVRILQLEFDKEPKDFPPLRSLENPELQNNLPSQASSFIGREAELSDVRALVETRRLVTLTGPGGSGKTRLALQVAAALLDGSGDGVWLVEMAPISDEELVAPTIAETLGISKQAGRPVEETLVDALQTQNILIVLDNCEHLVGTCAKLTDNLVRRCPHLHIIVTSREPLGIAGEAIYRVPSMSLPPGNDTDVTTSDAVALFVERAQAQDVALQIDKATAPLLASICRRLDGMPLAIELAAARLRSMSLSALHERLHQRFRLLTGGSRSALKRQQTLWATVDWSYSLLNDAERTLLCRLTVFAESFALEAAEAVCGFGGIEVFGVAELLGLLVDKSLVQTEAAGSTLRYRLLETIRQFAAERLLERDGEAVVVEDAHCAFFLALAEEALPHLRCSEQIEWASRLDLDHANLRRAFEQAKGGRNAVEYSLRFGWALIRYWMMRGQEAEGVELLRHAVGDPHSLADPSLLLRGLIASSHLELAGSLLRGADLSTAISWSDRAVELAAEVGDEFLAIDALSTRADASYFTGEFERGLKAGEEALERARILGDPGVLARTLSIHLRCSDRLHPENTDALLAEAIDSGERAGDLLPLRVLLDNASMYALRKAEIWRPHATSSRARLPRVTRWATSRTTPWSTWAGSSAKSTTVTRPR